MIQAISDNEIQRIREAIKDWTLEQYEDNIRDKLQGCKADCKDFLPGDFEKYVFYKYVIGSWTYGFVLSKDFICEQETWLDEEGKMQMEKEIKEDTFMGIPYDEAYIKNCITYLTNCKLTYLKDKKFDMLDKLDKSIQIKKLGTIYDVFY